MKYTENVNRFEKKDNGGVTLKKQYFYCLSYCYLHSVFKQTGQKNEDAMVNSGAKCATNCTVLFDAKLSHISMGFCAPFVKYLSKNTRFILPNINDGVSSLSIENKFQRGSLLYKHTCCIPDDCIDPRRLPLFLSRAFFRDLFSKLEACRSEEAQP